MNLTENINIAFRALKNNLTRSILTMMIIAVGITSLVGILTAIDGVVFSLNDNFASLGANSFSIAANRDGVRGSRGGRKAKTADPITYKEATSFKEDYQFPGSSVSVSLYSASAISIKYEEKVTSPNYNVIAVDENYLDLRKMEVSSGRSFGSSEVNTGIQIALVGQDIAKDLFGGNDYNAIGKSIVVDNRKYNIVGVLKSKGKSMNNDDDKLVLIPLYSGKRFYGSARSNYNISVSLASSENIQAAMANATGVFRNVRSLKAALPNDFKITSSDSLLEDIRDNTKTLRQGAVGISILTLLGAAIGLMNIMLVSVNERTREIGVRKALGAKNNSIYTQFLTEAILVCQIGGFIGILFSLLIGFLLSSLVLKSTFVIPWLWIGISIIVSLVVGLLAGFIPAQKASKLDPIESLRYE